MKPIYKIRLQKGDTVVVRAGKQRGKTGKVIAVHPSLNKVTVEGVNVIKRAVKPSRTSPQGGFVEKTLPIWVSKVSLFDGKKASRIGFKQVKDAKVRVYKTTGKEVAVEAKKPAKSGRSK